MTDTTWDRLVIFGKLAAFCLPLVGAVIVVYASLEVVKTDLRYVASENQQLREDVTNWRAELRGDIAELRQEIREVWNGRHP